MHLGTNGIGLAIAVRITPGQSSDDTGALPLLDADGPAPKALLADRGYYADGTYRQTASCPGAIGVSPLASLTRTGRDKPPLRAVAKTGRAPRSLGPRHNSHQRTGMAFHSCPETFWQASMKAAPPRAPPLSWLPSRHSPAFSRNMVVRRK